MKISLLHLTDSRPHAPEFQEVIDILNDATVAAVEALGWDAELVAGADLPLERTLEAVAASDAVVVMGGEDVAPRFYGGRDDYPEADRHLEEADEAHLAAIRAAASAGTPLLGICRGQQLVNVAFGGTLIQHMDNADDHRAEGAGLAAFAPHIIRAVPGTDMEHDILDEASYCTHHQAIDVLADDLEVTAFSADGTVEAVIHRGAPVTAVQWHPEHPATAGTQLTQLLLRLARQAAVRGARV